MAKTLRNIVGVGILGISLFFSSCYKSDNYTAKNEKKEQYHFSEYGPLKPFSKGFAYTIDSVVMEDVDGDGDLDMIVIGEAAEITIIENKIPQKGKN